MCVFALATKRKRKERERRVMEEIGFKRKKIKRVKSEVNLNNRLVTRFVYIKKHFSIQLFTAED